MFTGKFFESKPEILNLADHKSRIISDKPGLVDEMEAAGAVNYPRWMSLSKYSCIAIVSISPFIRPIL
jgi:hypothetical protein